MARAFAFTEHVDFGRKTLRPTTRVYARVRPKKPMAARLSNETGPRKSREKTRHFREPAAEPPRLMDVPTREVSMVRRLLKSERLSRSERHVDRRDRYLLLR
jgi:hypothetical protein